MNWTGSTRQEKSTRALKGTSVIKWVNKMTGKQHVIQKTMIIIFKLKLFSMFLLQNPSSQLPKWGDGENWKVYYFVNNLHWLQAQSTWKIHKLYACVHLWSRRLYTSDKLLSLSWGNKSKTKKERWASFPKRTHGYKNICKKRKACSCITAVSWFKRQ